MSRLFAFHCSDSERAPALREQHLQAHLDHVEAHIARYAVAGPLQNGEKTVGSLLLIHGQSEDEAHAFLKTDPYFAAGVWREIEVHEFRAVAGDWVGGAAWKRG